MSPLSQTFVTKTAADQDPFPLYKFWVEMNSIVVAQFQECSGLRMERDYEKLEEGGVNDHWIYLPGRNRYSNIILKNGMAYTNELWNWYQEGLFDAKVKRVNFTILLRDGNGEVAKRWNVISGFPVRWEGPQFTSDSNQLAIETLEIAHHGLTLGR
jgi:phage tail-like protein